ncbi:MAG: hypothetical protein JOZ41_19890 [Chloroflexi bacterium]|nr:hypothetical protein [Chloroflexota bacterium]
MDGRADIYSLGAVLYQMVTGRPPFEGRDPLSVAFKQVHKQPPPPSDLNAEVPEDWEAVILKALAKDPRDRFQTAVAVRDAIASLGTTEVRPVQEPTAGVPPASPPPLQAGSPAASARPMKPAGAPGQSQPAESGGAAAASSIVSPTPTVRGYQHPPEREGSTRYQGATAGVGPVPTVTASPTVAESRFEGAATEVAAGSAPQVRRRRLLPWLALAGAVVLVPVVPTAVLITRSESAPSASAPTATAVPPTPTPVRLALSTGHASAFASGQTVTLRWTAVPGARYRLQIALLPADPSIAAVFRHARTILTSHTSYRLRVEGYRYYYWRVRARVRGRWHPYSRAQRFVVARPSIGRAGPRTPVNGTRTRAKAMRLCWSGVTGAAAYRLWVNGTARTVRATCTWLAVRPGAYRWAVAALVQAARLYSGPVSPAATFTILQPPTPTPRPTATPRPTPVPTQLPTTSSTGSSTLGTSTGLSTSSASTTGSSAAGSGSTGTTGTTGTGYSTYSTSGTTGTTGTSATGSGTSGTTTGTSGTTGTGSSTSGTGSSTTGSGSSSSGTSTSGTGSTSSSSGSSTNCNPEVQAC